MMVLKKNGIKKVILWPSLVFVVGVVFFVVFGHAIYKLQSINRERFTFFGVLLVLFISYLFYLFCLVREKNRLLRKEVHQAYLSQKVRVMTINSNNTKLIFQFILETLSPFLDRKIGRIYFCDETNKNIEPSGSWYFSGEVQGFKVGPEIEVYINDQVNKMMQPIRQEKKVKWFAFSQDVSIFTNSNDRKNLKSGFLIPFFIDKKLVFLMALFGFKKTQPDLSELSFLQSISDEISWILSSKSLDGPEVKQATSINHLLKAREADFENPPDYSSLIGEAIADKMVAFMYQPVMDVRRNTISIINAELVFTDPNLKDQLMDQHFFYRVSEPLLEELALIAFDRLCQQVVEWDSKWVDKRFQVFVQSTWLPIASRSLLEKAKKIFSDHAIDPSRFILLFPVSWGKIAIAHLFSAVENWRQLGVNFAIDGLSLSYDNYLKIKLLPMAFLVISKKILLKWEDENLSASWANWIIELASSIHLDILVQGISDEENKYFFDQLTCRYMQGDYFSRAMTSVLLDIFLSAYMKRYDANEK